MKMLTAVVGAALVARTVACSQYTTATGPDTFRGCLQGDAAKGFSLLSPTGDGSGADTKGQTMTYEVVPAGSDVDLSAHGEQDCRGGGTVSTEAVENRVDGSARARHGAGRLAVPAARDSLYANGTLTARSIRELEPTCAVRFAPDRDEPSK